MKLKDVSNHLMENDVSVILHLVIQVWMINVSVMVKVGSSKLVVNVSAIQNWDFHMILLVQGNAAA